MTWISTDRAHWSGAALFYCSLLFALIAVVLGSQQLLALPKADVESDEDPIVGANGSVVWSPRADAHQRQQGAAAIQKRLTKQADGRGAVELRARFVFMLQAPIMMLMFSVMTFLAGLCSVVYSPLAQNLQWNDDAKVRA